MITEQKKPTIHINRNNESHRHTYRHTKSKIKLKMKQRNKYVISIYCILHNMCIIIDILPNMLPHPTKTAPHPWDGLYKTLWRCPVVSSTKMLAADPLSPASCKFGATGIGLPTHHTDARLDWDLGNLQARATSLCSSNHSGKMCAVWEGTLFCWKRPLPSRNTVTHEGVYQVLNDDSLSGMC